MDLTDQPGTPESYEPFGYAWQLPDVLALAVAANEATDRPNRTSDGTDESEEYDG